MSKFVRLLILTLALSSPIGAQAESLGTIPDRGTRLGAGFDPVNPDEVFPSCVLAKAECQTGVFQGIQCLNASDGITKTSYGEFAPSSQVSIREIKSKYDYLRELNISASVSGSYGAFSGSASFSYSSLEDIDEESVSWAVTARSSYGSFSLQHPEVSAEFKKLTPSQLVQACGPEYVSEVDRGVLASVLYTFHSRSERFERELKASLSANFGTTGAGIGGKGSMSELIKEASKYGTISIRVFTIGGQGATALKDLIAQDPSDLPKVRQVLAQYVNGQGVAHSTILGFRTTAVGKLVGRADIDPDYSPYLIFLERYNEYRLRLEELSQRIYQILTNQDDFRPRVSIARVRALNRSIDDELNCINQKARLCRAWSDLLSQILSNGNPDDDFLASFEMTHGFGPAGANFDFSSFSVNTVRQSASLTPGVDTACLAERSKISSFAETIKQTLIRRNRQSLRTDWNPCTVTVNADLFAETHSLPRVPFEILYAYSGFRSSLTSTGTPMILVSLRQAERATQIVALASDEIIATKSNMAANAVVNLAVSVKDVPTSVKDLTMEVDTKDGSYQVTIRIPPR
ncbi:hypothetical protein GR223_05160 [Rhizobium leguminosarum]|uniref:hypothetical protein n=1 Tax=Rhizobium ruizarguesonis TaxID=2081791 RepID=UPI0013E09637|nr:hypothetical protein [Rhizobium ruizarguesonis]NEJ85340.1 hypothetical protein [Rhizobium ruizarguesonis]